MPIHVGDQLFIFFLRQPLLHIQQIFLEPGNGVALAPVLEQRLGDVLGGVVDGVSFHAHHLGFDEGGAFAAAGALAAFVGGIVDLAGISPVHDHAGNAVGNGALG